MKEIKKYTKLTLDLIERLNSENFKFVKFNEFMDSIELITLEENNKILGYAILEHCSKMNKDALENMIYEIESRIEDSEYYMQQLDESDYDFKREELSFNSLKESLKLINTHDFHYLSYIETTQLNVGNGSLMVDYIKKNYPATVLIPSGYTPKDSSFDFWVKKGYKYCNFLMIASN